jgi:hypothetical protein
VQRKPELRLPAFKMIDERVVQQMRERLSGISDRYYRLLLLVGTAGSGKTAALNQFAALESCKTVNLGIELATQLLDLTERQRILRLPKLLEDIISDHDGRFVILDNTEILFTQEIQQDPLRLLQGLSRNRTIVASWFGTFDGQDLFHAGPNHPEFRKYPAENLVIVATSNRGAETNCWDTQI